MAESRDRQGRKDGEIRDRQSSRRECEVPRKELVFNKKPMLAAGHLRSWRRESAVLKPSAETPDFFRPNLSGLRYVDMISFEDKLPNLYQKT